MVEKDYYSLIGKGETYNRFFLEHNTSWSAGKGHPQRVVKGYVHIVTCDPQKPHDLILILHDWSEEFDNMEKLITEKFGAKEVYVRNCYHFYEANTAHISGYLGRNQEGEDGLYF